MKNQDTNTDFASELSSQLPSMKESAKQQQASVASTNINHIPNYKGKDGKSAPWGTEDMRNAMRDIADMSEKTMINFFMLGDIAKAVHERDDMIITDKIEIGMKANGLTPEILSLFNTWGFEPTKYGYKYYYTPPLKWDIMIPVEIHVIKRNYKFFENLDFGFYAVDTFHIPNPFEKYWKARFLIK